MRHTANAAVGGGSTREVAGRAYPDLVQDFLIIIIIIISANFPDYHYTYYDLVQVFLIQ